MTADRLVAERPELREHITALTTERDQARAIAVALEQEIAEVRRLVLVVNTAEESKWLGASAKLAGWAKGGEL